MALCFGKDIFPQEGCWELGDAEERREVVLSEKFDIEEVVLGLSSQLRNLEDDFEKITIMEPISSFFKLEKDPFFKKGFEKGIEIGLEKGMKMVRMNYARALKNEGVSLEVIIKLSKLSAEEIEKL